MPETIKVPGATHLLLVAADVNDQVGVFVVLGAYSAFILSGRSLNSETAYAAQIPQHFHDTTTTVFVSVQEQLSVWETIIARPRGLAVGQCRHGGGAEPALHSRHDLRVVDLPIRWAGQLTFMARALMGGTYQRHYVHDVPRRSSAGERISLTFRRLLRAPAP